MDLPIIPIEDYPLNDRHEPSALEGWTLQTFTAIRKKAGLFCESFLRKGKVFAYVERIQTLKDLKVFWRIGALCAFRNFVVPPLSNSLSRSPRTIYNGGLCAIRKGSGFREG